jgi:hypothetical protein
LVPIIDLPGEMHGKKIQSVHSTEPCWAQNTIRKATQLAIKKKIMDFSIL